MKGKMILMVGITAILVYFGVLVALMTDSIKSFFIGDLYTLVCLLILFGVSDIEW